MLTLLLLRHGKAEPPRGEDFARSLTEKGERDAADIGVFLAEHSLCPQLALVSPAARTSRTFELVARGQASDIEVHREDALYNASDAAMLTLIGRLDKRSAVVLVVGHNPGIMEVAVALAQDGDRVEIDRLRGRFPPCGLAVLSFDVEDWGDACATGGRLDALVFPEDLVGD